MTADEVYERAVRPLPIAERLKVATLILNDLQPQLAADYSDDWSDEDVQDIMRHSLERAAESFEEAADD
jgi:hypothetical protein